MTITIQSNTDTILELPGLPGTLGPGKTITLSTMTEDLVRAIDLGLLLVPSGAESPDGLPPVVFEHQYPHALPLSADRAYYVRVLRSSGGFDARRPWLAPFGRTFGASKSAVLPICPGLHCRSPGREALMCGLAGVIFGKKRRRADLPAATYAAQAGEREYLAWLFTRLLVMSECRGPHATGVAWLNRDGEHRLFKRPVPAGQFVTDKAYHKALASIDNRTTILLGHTRWRTHACAAKQSDAAGRRGDERVNRNNHPIRAGDIIGTHNGTIYNADYLFRRFKLRRFAQVDSAIDCGFRIGD